MIDRQIAFVTRAKVLGVLGITLALGMLSCSNVKAPQPGSGSNEPSTAASVANSLESAVASISAVADEVANETYAQNQLKPQNLIERLDSVIGLGKSAWAAAPVCTRAHPNATGCLGGVFTEDATYAGCSLGTSGFTVTGHVRLLWSRVGCIINNVDDHVTRTMDYTRTGPSGGQLQVTSANHNTYDNTPVGDGQVLTSIALPGDYNMKVMGVRKIFTTSTNKVLYDHSLISTTDFHVKNLARASRTIVGGAIDVYHNILKFKASYSVSSTLAFTDKCCYPTSGQLKATLNGSLTGAGVIDFQSTCGSVILTYLGTQTPITLALCE